MSMACLNPAPYLVKVVVEHGECCSSTCFSNDKVKHDTSFYVTLTAIYERPFQSSSHLYLSLEAQS